MDIINKAIIATEIKHPLDVIDAITSLMSETSEDRKRDAQERKDEERTDHQEGMNNSGMKESDFL